MTQDISIYFKFIPSIDIYFHCKTQYKYELKMVPLITHDFEINDMKIKDMHLLLLPIIMNLISIQGVY